MSNMMTIIEKFSQVFQISLANIEHMFTVAVDNFEALQTPVHEVFELFQRYPEQIQSITAKRIAKFGIDKDNPPLDISLANSLFGKERDILSPCTPAIPGQLITITALDRLIDKARQQYAQLPYREFTSDTWRLMHNNDWIFPKLIVLETINVMPIRGQWITYRRNNMSISCAVVIPKVHSQSELTIRNNDTSSTFPIQACAIRVSADHRFSLKQSATLCGVTRKRLYTGKVPKSVTPLDKALSDMINGEEQLDDKLQAISHTFDHFQFAQASLNTSDRTKVNAHRLRIIFQVGFGEPDNLMWVDVSELSSANILVRGKSPSYYSARDNLTQVINEDDGVPVLGFGVYTN